MHTILITGANRGIGLELTQQYLAADWRVIACCRHPDQADALNQLAKSYGKNLLIIALDVADTNAINQLSKQLANESIDILMNNAGVIGSRSMPLGEIDPVLWLETFKVNTIASLLIVQALIKQIAKSKLKMIVNISSSMSSISQNAEGGYYLYRSSKAALNAITKSLAIDLKLQEIIVIALHPGWVKTDMGGENAQISPEKSVQGIRHVLSTITMQESGTLISYDGTKIPF